MTPLLLVLLNLLLIPFATSSDFYDYYDSIFDGMDSGEQRRLQPDFENEPPVTPSKITNLFYDQMRLLLQTNEAQYVDTIAKYTDSSTQLLSCHRPGKTLNFSEFNQIMRYLFLYFKTVDAGGTSLAPADKFVKFEVKYNAVSQDKKNVVLTWQGEANYDDSKKYFIFSKIHMVSDCSQIPQEFPIGPVESLPDYLNRLRTALFQDIFLSNQPHQRPGYQAFTDDFLISRARVQFCDQNGQVKDRGAFSEFLFQRYGQITDYKEFEFSTEAFSSYQTDAMFSVNVMGQTRDTYRFRVSAQTEIMHGWPHWFVDYVEVMCAKDLNPSQNPRDLQDKFVGQVCGSISPMINNGQSVESRSTFLSHMNSRADAGFWAIICGRGGSPIGYGQLDEWLDSWSSGYKKCRLGSSDVQDYGNFEFICRMVLTKDGGSEVKREFKMKAFFETNQWLVKEVRVSCDV